ncbi:MAG: HEAT repeat domain-containing protein [Haloarculaceae archaeon]
MSDHDHGCSRDAEEATDGPTDPQVHPEASPGFDEDPDGLEDIEVSRDVTIGEASLRDLASSDTAPLEGATTEERLALLVRGDAVERRRAALSLAEGERTEDAVEALVRVARTDEDDDVRQFAVEALGKLGGDRAAEGALAVTRDEDPWVRAEAFVALDRLDRRSHADRIEAGLGDEHHAIRRNAAISVFKRRGEDALSDLLALVDDPSDRVREWAVHMLGGIDDERAREALRGVIEDDSEPDLVRTTAARALEADPGAFRRGFGGTIDRMTTNLPGEDVLNRRPKL